MIHYDLLYCDDDLLHKQAIPLPHYSEGNAILAILTRYIILSMVSQIIRYIHSTYVFVILPIQYA